MGTRCFESARRPSRRQRGHHGNPRLPALKPVGRPYRAALPYSDPLAYGSRPPTRVAYLPASSRAPALIGVHAFTTADSRPGHHKAPLLRQEVAPQVTGHPLDDVSELELLEPLRWDAAPAVNQPEQISGDGPGAIQLTTWGSETALFKITRPRPGTSDRARLSRGPSTGLGHRQSRPAQGLSAARSATGG